MTKHILVGQKAPALSLPNFDGETFQFTPGEGGRPVALFFYPQSGSYGCTKEACAFRDALTEEEVFTSTHVQVIGVSPDPVEKQKKFVEKHGISYPLLSDEKGEGRKAYHVSRGLLGLTSSSRVTFVIDSEGIVRDALDSTINFAAHSKFVHNWLTGQSKNITADKTKEAVKADEVATAAEPPPPVSTTAAAAVGVEPTPTPAAPVATEDTHAATLTHVPDAVPTAPEETVTPPATETAKEGDDLSGPTSTAAPQVVQETPAPVPSLDPAAAAPAAAPPTIV